MEASKHCSGDYLYGMQFITVGSKVMRKFIRVKSFLLEWEVKNRVQSAGKLYVTLENRAMCRYGAYLFMLFG